MLLPGHIIAHGFWRWVGCDTSLEKNSADHEESEEDYLDDKAADDNVVSSAL